MTDFASSCSRVLRVELRGARAGLLAFQATDLLELILCTAVLWVWPHALAQNVVESPLQTWLPLGRPELPLVWAACWPLASHPNWSLACCCCSVARATSRYRSLAASISTSALSLIASLHLSSLLRHVRVSDIAASGFRSHLWSSWFFCFWDLGSCWR
jgi:hypothetical protein